MALRDVSEMLWPAVQETLHSLDTRPEDAAARKLAQRYAQVIDSSNGHCAGCTDADCKRSSTSAWSMRWLGPLLLACLTELGATPAARAAMTRGTKGGQGKPAARSQLDIMREQRARGRGGA